MTTPSTTLPRAKGQVTLNHAPSPHSATQPRTRRWLAAFVGCLALAIALAATPWIPEWKTVTDGVMVALVLAAVVAGVKFFNAARPHVARRLTAKWRLVVNVLGALVLALLWAFVALVVGVASVGFPFGATYHSKHEFPEFDTTVYLYDSSFLEPETTVFLRQGWLPFRERVNMRFGRNPEYVDVVMHGSVLMLEDQQLDLRERR